MSQVSSMWSSFACSPIITPLWLSVPDSTSAYVQICQGRWAYDHIVGYKFWVLLLHSGLQTVNRDQQTLNSTNYVYSAIHLCYNTGILTNFLNHYMPVQALHNSLVNPLLWIDDWTATPVTWWQPLTAQRRQQLWLFDVLHAHSALAAASTSPGSP